VVSLPYHHPFTVAQRIVQLDYMTGGRALFGTSPSALPLDARTFGIDQTLLRDRRGEAPRPPFGFRRGLPPSSRRMPAPTQF
jgi:limonene 1,2-monooxygenase